MDKLYGGLETLEALRIDLQTENSWPEAFWNVQAKEISSFLRSLRARENFSLTFAFDGELVPQDLWDTSEGMAEELVVEDAEEYDSWSNSDESSDPSDNATAWVWAPGPPLMI